MFVQETGKVIFIAPVVVDACVVLEPPPGFVTLIPLESSKTP